MLTWTPTEAQGPSTNLITVKVTDNGTPQSSGTKSFTIVVAEANSAPVLTVPTDRTVTELKIGRASSRESDADLPANTLTFSLVSAPSGVNLDPSSGMLTWTTPESKGPSTNLNTVKVTDNGTPQSSGTKSFTIVVAEANSAPVLTVPTDRTVTELKIGRASSRESDADLPANTLTFSLVSAPSGVNLDPSSGMLTWTTPESKGPSTNLNTVKVTDNGTPQSSGTKSFTIVVAEANSAPVLTVPTDRTVTELKIGRASSRESDADLPANTLTFSLVSAPSGVNLDPSSGMLTWTTPESKGPSTNLNTVKVTDNGTPQSSGTKSFTIVVAEANSAPVLTVPTDRTVTELKIGRASSRESDADLPANTLTFSLVSAPSGVNLDPSSGMLTWTTPESKGPSTNLNTVKVTDNGTPQSSGTKSFTIVVAEANSAPVLTVPTDRTVTELKIGRASSRESDADLPANTLTFSLVSAPSGVNLDPSSGMLTWTTPESKGPSTNLNTVKVTDNGTPQSSGTKSFTIVVAEANSAPVLTVPTDRTVTELKIGRASSRESDADLPANTLTFSLVSAPSGVNLDPSSGMLTWTTPESKGPSTNLNTVKVTDNGTPQSSGTKSFTIVVAEANSAPVLTVPTDRTVTELKIGRASSRESDADLPANTLTFSLVSAPSGVNLDPSSGMLTWTTPESKGPSTNLNTVKVTDNGTPQSSDTKSFTIVVAEANSAPVLTVPTDRTVTELSTLTVTNSASDADLPADVLTFRLVSAPSVVNLDPSSGVLTWTPTEAKDPLSLHDALPISDNGTPQSSDTKSFTIVVTEANSAPVLTVPTDRTVPELSTLTVTNTA